MMHRTQVYFEKEVLEELRKEAKKKKKTLASVIREKVVKTLPKKHKKKKLEKEDAATVLMDLARFGEKMNVKGPKDLSQRIDEFVYRT